MEKGKTHRYDVSTSKDGGPKYLRVREGVTPGGRTYRSSRSEYKNKKTTSVQGRGSGSPLYRKETIGDYSRKSVQKKGDFPQDIVKGPTKKVGKKK